MIAYDSVNCTQMKFVPCIPFFFICNSVTISVMASGNKPPVANDDYATTGEDTTVTIDVLNGIPGADSDPDPADILTSISATSPENGVVSLNPDGTINYTPNPNFFGHDSFVYTIHDGKGGIATATGEYCLIHCSW